MLSKHRVSWQCALWSIHVGLFRLVNWDLQHIFQKISFTVTFKKIHTVLELQIKNFS